MHVYLVEISSTIKKTIPYHLSDYKFPRDQFLLSKVSDLNKDSF